jgi:hypothetical protein
MPPPAMADDALSGFVRRAKEHGVSDESLLGILKQSGWPERRVYRALSEYYAGVLGIAAPARGQSVESPRDAFLYLLNFITLGFWAVALWQVWDDLVRRWFPDRISAPTGEFLLSDIAWQVALIVVAFPIFLVVHAFIQKELARRPELYYSGVRRWLTYVTLVVAAITIVVDAAYTVQALILGQLTIHFVLDTLALIVLGGGIFAYYLLTIDPQAQPE